MAGVKNIPEIRTIRSWGHAITRVLDDGKQKNTNPVLDGVRAIACLSVLVFHVNFALNTIHVSLPTLKGLQTLTNALLHGPNWLKRPFAWMPLRWLGWISFSLYMWHDPLIEFFTSTVLAPLRPSLHPTSLLIVLLWVWVLLVIIPISVASYILIEKPGMRLDEKLRRKLFKPRQAAISKPQQEQPPARETAPQPIYDTPTSPVPAASSHPGNTQ